MVCCDGFLDTTTIINADTVTVAVYITDILDISDSDTLKVSDAV